MFELFGGPLDGGVIECITPWFAVPMKKRFALYQWDDETYHYKGSFTREELLEEQDA